MVFLCCCVQRTSAALASLVIGKDFLYSGATSDESCLRMDQGGELGWCPEICKLFKTTSSRSLELIPPIKMARLSAFTKNSKLRLALCLLLPMFGCGINAQKNGNCLGWILTISPGMPSVMIPQLPQRDGSKLLGTSPLTRLC